MSLVLAALMPHSPLLVPNIGKEHTAHFSVTLDAAKKIKEALILAEPDLIFILTTKGPSKENGFTIHSAQEYKANFELFGDLVTDLRFNSDIQLIGELREKLETKFPIFVVANLGLDYASSIPLLLLEEAARKPIIPITTSSIALSEAVKFGEELQKIILDSPKKIAVIVSADLSHRLSKQSPAGYSSKAKKFDQRLIEILKDADNKSLIESETAANDAACEDMPSLAVFLGILNDVGYELTVSQYDPQFGVGHLSLLYNLGRS